MCCGNGLTKTTWHTWPPRARHRLRGPATSPRRYEAEVDGIINRVHTPQDPQAKVVFERTSSAHRRWPFANFNGNVEEIDDDQAV